MRHLTGGVHNTVKLVVLQQLRIDKNNLQRVQKRLLGVREGHEERYSDFGRQSGTFQLFPKYTVEIFGLRENSYSQGSKRNIPGSAGGAES